jgi:hypothetical protein
MDIGLCVPAIDFFKYIIESRYDSLKPNAVGLFRYTPKFV